MLVGACKHAVVLARRSNDFVHVAILTLEIGFESEAGPKTPLHSDKFPMSLRWHDKYHHTA